MRSEHFPEFLIKETIIIQMDALFYFSLMIHSILFSQEDLSSTIGSGRLPRAMRLKGGISQMTG